MPRPFRFRLIALVVALLGGFAAPASAVTHGWLHDHAAHEKVDHHAQDADTEGTAARVEIAHGAEAEQSDDHHRHGHDAVDIGPAAREALRVLGAAVIAFTANRLELPDAEVVESPSVAFLKRGLLVGPDPGGTSPPSLRAPPNS